MLLTNKRVTYANFIITCVSVLGGSLVMPPCSKPLFIYTLEYIRTEGYLLSGKYLDTYYDFCRHFCVIILKTDDVLRNTHNPYTSPPPHLP